VDLDVDDLEVAELYVVPPLQQSIGMGFSPNYLAVVAIVKDGGSV
jgi:hypothetical protein